VLFREGNVPKTIFWLSGCLIAATLMAGSARAQGGVGYVPCRADRPPNLVFFSAPYDENGARDGSKLKQVMKLKCGEPMRILSEEPEPDGFALVKKGNKQGYAPKALIWPYVLHLKVLQSDSLPYEVPIGGGEIQTSCNITGTVDTSISVWSQGSYSRGTAYSYPNLQMSCRSREIPPSGWRHVLNMMLVAASDGNAYIMACDRAWAWSKCNGLRAGDVFPAYWQDDKLKAIYSDDKGDIKEAGAYSILDSRVLTGQNK